MRVLVAIGFVCCGALSMGAEPNNLPADSTQQAGDATNSNRVGDEAGKPTAKDQTTIIDAKACKTKLCELLKCVDANFDPKVKQADKKSAAKPADIKCKIMAVTSGKATGSFTTQQDYPPPQKEWFPSGQADVTAANWPVIKKATSAALKEEKLPTVMWYSPAVGLQVTVPPGAANCPAAGQYLILMYFDTQSLEYYYFANSTANAPATTYGNCCIRDNRPWRD